MVTANDKPRARSGCAVAVGCSLVVLFGLVLISDLGIASFMCMDSQGDNMGCAVGVVAGHWPAYAAAIGGIAVVAYVVRRMTR